MGAGRLLAAGPFADQTGGLFFHQAASLEDAEGFAARDPFQPCGVFGGVELEAWTPVALDANTLERAL